MKLYYLIIIILFFISGQLAFGQAQGIKGSRHDFRDLGLPDNQLCIPCHAPHLNTSEIVPPLWNHELTTTNFTLYESVSLDATMGQPDGNSKLCLSCHDGTVPIKSFGGNTGTTKIWRFYIGALGHLEKDHPVSFVYDNALVNKDGGLKDPSGASGLGRSIAEDMLFEGKVQCASCHEIHGPRGTLADGKWPYLRKSRYGSELCLTCHNK